MRISKVGFIAFCFVIQIQNGFADCASLMSWLGIGREVQRYPEVVKAIAEMQNSLQAIHELSERPWKPLETFKMADMIDPRSKVDLTQIRDHQDDFRSLLQSLKQVAQSLETLSARLDEPAVKFLNGRADPLLHLMTTRIIYGNSFVYALRLLERFREAPDWMNIKNGAIQDTLDTVDLKQLDQSLKTIVKLLRDGARATSPTVVEAIDDFMKSSSQARLQFSATIQPRYSNDEDPQATSQRWMSFIENRKKVRAALDAVKVAPLTLPNIDTVSSSEPARTDAPTDQTKKPIIDEALAKDLGVAPTEVNGATSRGSKSGIIPKTEAQIKRALDLMPRKQREAELVRRAQDAKLKAARQGSGGAAKPTE